MAEILRLARTEDAPAPMPGDFVQTETAAAIMGSLNLIRALDGGGVTMIAGASGIGKTTTLAVFAHGLDQGALYISVAKGEGSTSCIAYSIARHFGPDPHGFLLQGELTMRRKKLADFIGRKRVLLVDNAHNLHQRDPKTGLKGAGFEWLMACQELGGFALAFCGNLTLPDIMEEDAPDLLNRTRRPLCLKGVAKADVQALAQCWGVRDPDALKALSEVATRRGGLRNVVNVLNLAMDFGGGTATPASIKVAIEAEGLTRKAGV